MKFEAGMSLDPCPLHLEASIGMCKHNFSIQKHMQVLEIMD